MNKPPAPRKAFKLKSNLEALVASPGTPEEGAAAQKKLEKLLSRFDFTPPDVSKEGLFAGSFQASADVRPVIHLQDFNLTSHVKWAIEESTGIRCVFHGATLLAHATPATAAKLASIGHTIAAGFGALWGTFQGFPTVSTADRPLFLRGLYDGMMNQQKPAGEPLPARPSSPKRGRNRKSAVGHAAGMSLHPYAVALDLGRQIRFNVPIPEVTQQLENLNPKQLRS